MILTITVIGRVLHVHPDHISYGDQIDKVPTELIDALT